MIQADSNRRVVSTWRDARVLAWTARAWLRYSCNSVNSPLGEALIVEQLERRALAAS